MRPPASSAASDSAARNASASSASVRVNSSSNWSTTSRRRSPSASSRWIAASRRPVSVARRAVSVTAGCPRPGSPVPPRALRRAANRAGASRCACSGDSRRTSGRSPACTTLDFPDAAGADHRGEGRRTRHPRGELGDQTFLAEEPGGVGLAERAEPHVGVLGARRRRRRTPGGRLARDRDRDPGGGSAPRGDGVGVTDRCRAPRPAPGASPGTRAARRPDAPTGRARASAAPAAPRGTGALV